MVVILTYLTGSLSGGNKIMYVKRSEHMKLLYKSKIILTPQSFMPGEGRVGTQSVVMLTPKSEF